MGTTTELTASDGHRLSAYLSEPSGRPKGGMVIVQEIFGITRHIRAVVDQYAEAGYLSIAPAVFDRVERNVEVPYTDGAKGFGYVKRLKIDQVFLDLAAAVERVRGAGKVGVVGYCWGGMIAFRAASRLNVAAAIAYYGGGIDQHLGEKPRVPVLFHFGEKDTHIPMTAVEQTKAAYPEGTYFLYPAEHGFNCTDRASYDPPSAKLALERSLEFLHRKIG